MECHYKNSGCHLNNGVCDNGCVSRPYYPNDSLTSVPINLTAIPTGIFIGKYYITHGLQHGHMYIQQFHPADGLADGGDFPIEDLEKMLDELYARHYA